MTMIGKTRYKVGLSANTVTNMSIFILNRTAFNHKKELYQFLAEQFLIMVLQELTGQD